MPSVEMRRTTRVFGARVLRSGRRLFTTQDELKHLRRPPLAVAGADENWIELLDHHGGGGGANLEIKENGWRNSNQETSNQNQENQNQENKNQETKNEKDEILEVDDGELRSKTKSGESMDSRNQKWGNVYSRKRKRTVSMDSGDKKYGMKFFRKQTRKKTIKEEILENPPPISQPEPVLAPKPKTIRKKPIIAFNSSNMQLRNGFQKRRSSLRSRIQRNPSRNFSHLKKPLGNNVVQDGVPFFPIKSNRKTSYKELKSTLMELTQDLDSASCNTNILVIQSDRCYRVPQAVVSVETVGPQQWSLVVKKDDVLRLRIEARNVMRPCFCNRITHAIIWADGDESWRLEFPDRQHWFVFKELYRKCSERNVRVPVSPASIIPVPRVSEVKGYADVAHDPFRMPDSYIRCGLDEVSRVLETGRRVYDMDSDDERWLEEFNGGRGPQGVGEDDFEKIIDAYERGIYVSPLDYSDAISAVDRCLELGSKEVLEAVYGYWMDKRKKQNSALVRVFQFYKPKKTEQLNIKSVLRKKRSFRQRGSQVGRGKQLNFLKAAFYEKRNTDKVQETVKVQETETAAEIAEQSAVVKRQRAQLLMEVADLLTYKATLALRIAEARATSESVEDRFLGEWLNDSALNDSAG